MCRSIKPLYNFDPPASDEEIRAAATQFVRKLSGFAKPSATNQAAFDHAVAEITHTARHLFGDLTTTAPPKDRELEAAKARERFTRRQLPGQI
jgi:hypothetical protein